MPDATDAHWSTDGPPTGRPKSEWDLGYEKGLQEGVVKGQASRDIRAAQRIEDLEWAVKRLKMRLEAK